tara:strand:+ start:308 stop:550 length:243 start_codon:yes stop_codon:yes gene_type:complete
MQKLYVGCKSKKSLNERIKSGEDIVGIEYNLFNPEGYQTFHNLKELKRDTIIAIYKKEGEQDVPEAHCWGIYEPLLNNIV